MILPRDPETFNGLVPLTMDPVQRIAWQTGWALATAPRLVTTSRGAVDRTRLPTSGLWQQIFCIADIVRPLSLAEQDAVILDQVRYLDERRGNPYGLDFNI